MTRLARQLAVTLLVAFALASVWGTASELWTDRGTVGLTTDYSATVRGVDPDGPASRAGILPGDRIDLAPLPVRERRELGGVAVRIRIGAVLAFDVARGATTRHVTLVAVRQTLSGPERLSIALQSLASLVFVVVGAALVLVRPTAATWGFGLFCLLDLPTAYTFFEILPRGYALAATLAYDVVENLGTVGLLVFALDFPHRRDVPWRTNLLRAVPAIFVALVAMTLYPDVSIAFLGRGAEGENEALQLAFGAIFLVATFALHDTYRRVAPVERERLRWVMLGFVAGLLPFYVGNTLIYSALIALELPDWLVNALITLNVLLPLAVAHAVVRKRVLDVNFVVSRALVYATLTAILAAVFELLDYVFGNVLEEFRLSRWIEAAIAIGIAFAFDSLHERTKDLVEGVFFRRRLAADARVDRLIHELPEARSERVVERALVDEAADAYSLASAAVYRRDATGAYARTAARGWRDGELAALDEGDVLVLSLAAQKRAIRLAALPWHHAELPHGAGAPVLAVPLCSRSQLVGFALYGGHTGGGEIDASEISQLEHLAHGASVGLDEVEAERLRAELARQRTAVVALEARVDELRAIARSVATGDQRAAGTISQSIGLNA